MLIGCRPNPLGTTEPLLPVLEGQAKFSDRFELEEEPQFFYDLFGKELLEGHQVHEYIEEKIFNEKGQLVTAYTGQLDSLRFTSQLDRTILTEDTFRGRHIETAIGDSMRIKPETLFPNGYAIHKTEFDGLRLDLSFSQERHLFSFLHSRISNPIHGPDMGAATTMDPTMGRRNNESFLENVRLMGFRGQGMLGDIFRVGLTYLNLHKEHPLRLDNPIMGTVANTPPGLIVVTFRDDSPWDNHPDVLNENVPDDFKSGGVGVAFKEMKITLVTRRLIKTADAEMGMETDPETGEEVEVEIRPAKYELQPEEIKTATVGIDAVGPSKTPAPGTPYSMWEEVADTGGETKNGWQVAEGFNSFQYGLDFEDPPAEFQDENGRINPRTVQSITFEFTVAGDYHIEILGYSPQNEGAAEDLWWKQEDGHIDMPFRDVITAPGNYGQDDDYTDNRTKYKEDPSKWPARKVKYEYGAARAAVILGIDLEGTLLNTFIRAQWSINQKHKQYPTISKDKVSYSEKAKTDVYDFSGEYDDEQFSSFSDIDGYRFEAKLGGDGTAEDGDGEMQSETAWFLNLKQRWGKLLLEAARYHIDPGYTTTYRNFGANTDRDETYSLPRTGEMADTSPYDDGNYILIEDDDDNDDWPDDDDFDGVLPEADDRDKNGILDFQEDFLIFDADPPVFEDLVDLNNNGVVDSLEDDTEPQYPYGINRDGWHLTANYELLANMNLILGWLSEDEVSSERRNDTKYFHLNYQRDIPDFGTILFQDRYVRANDSIPDYALTLLPGETDPVEIVDRLDYYDARVNTASLQFLYTAVPNLSLETKFLVVHQKQNEIDKDKAIVLDDEDTELDERVDFMIPLHQDSGDLGNREVPFYPDYTLIFDSANWAGRRYEDKNIRKQTTIFKAKYEIPLGNIPHFDKIGEDLALTPMVKYVWERYFDTASQAVPATDCEDPERGKVPMAISPRIAPGDEQVLEYLRFNKRSREDIMGLRLDYQFTQRATILGGFQYRKYSNRDENFKRYLKCWPDASLPELYKSNIRHRIYAIQSVSRGEWLGFNIVVLLGFQRQTWLFPEKGTSDTIYAKAMMGF